MLICSARPARTWDMNPKSILKRASNSPLRQVRPNRVIWTQILLTLLPSGGKQGATTEIKPELSSYTPKCINKLWKSGLLGSILYLFTGRNMDINVFDLHMDRMEIWIICWKSLNVPTRRSELLGDLSTIPRQRRRP